jgi:hypothetical protein
LNLARESPVFCGLYMMTLVIMAMLKVVGGKLDSAVATTTRRSSVPVPGATRVAMVMWTRMVARLVDST